MQQNVKKVQAKTSTKSCNIFTTTSLSSLYHHISILERVENAQT